MYKRRLLFCNEMVVGLGLHVMSSLYMRCLVFRRTADLERRLYLGVS